MNRNRRVKSRRFRPNFFLLPYGTLHKNGIPFFLKSVEITRIKVVLDKYNHKIKEILLC